MRLPIVDRTKFFGVLAKIAKYQVFIPLITSSVLSPVYSLFSLLANSHGRFCGDHADGLVYHDGYDCYLDLLNLFEVLPVIFLGIFLFFFVIVFLIVFLFYVIYLIYAPARLGLGSAENNAA